MRITDPDHMAGDYFSGKHRLRFGELRLTKETLMNITAKYERLLARRAPAEDRAFRKFAESIQDERGKATSVILGAIFKEPYSDLEFRRHGSVSNNTHIRYHSDVDVLTIIDKFVGLEPPQKPLVPYTRNPVDNLAVLRQHCVRVRACEFPAASVDDDNSTAVCISGGSLACCVDVVPANWFNTNEYATKFLGHHWGVQVLNKATRERI